MNSIKKYVVLYICLLILTLFTTACTSNKITPESDTDIFDTKETGSFKKGGFMYSDYWIDLECPNTGHHFGSIDSLWSTYYVNETDERVDVDIYGIEGNLASLIDELTTNGIEVSEGVLWHNECYFYIDEITVALIPLGKKNYLQIEFEHEDGVVVENSSIPDTFTMKITLAFLRDEEDTTEADEEYISKIEKEIIDDTVSSRHTEIDHQ